MLRRGVLSRALDHFQLHGESKIACFCGQKALLYSAIVTKREIEPDMSKSITLGPLGECRMETPLKSRTYVSDDTRVLVDATTGPDGMNPKAETLELAGPRRCIHFDPTEVVAGIVTCGGLCPGLNDVIRALTMVLHDRYGVRRILGFRYGYEGLIQTYGHDPIALTPELVEDIHNDGGTILGSSRGRQDTNDIVDHLAAQGVRMLFTIGGDGTQRGSSEIAAEVRRRGLDIAIVGIPKTIDNDVNYTERTFGFDTAVAMSRAPITGIHKEAKSVRNGVGLVKLMGRESGFVAAHASLASSDVNLVLVPEVPFTLERLFDYLEERLAKKSHAVIVVAEGAGQAYVQSRGNDASGNVKFGDIGLFLKQAIADHFETLGTPAYMKYVDPSYIIRSAPATANDSVFCFQLGAHAVHAAMSGRTGIIIGLWNGHFVHVPVEKAVEQRKCINPDGLLWQAILDNTGQPANLS
jgi:6-phosphofructokinase 1